MQLTPPQRIRTERMNKGIKSSRRCSLDGCNEIHYGKGFCQVHWKRLKAHGSPFTTKVESSYGLDAEKAFWGRVELTANPDKCWPWRACVNSDGYGHMVFRGKLTYPHRIAWFLTTGQEPQGLLRHLVCDNPPCVNPRHLKEGTHQDNMDDMVRRNRMRLSASI